MHSNSQENVPVPFYYEEGIRKAQPALVRILGSGIY